VGAALVILFDVEKNEFLHREPELAHSVVLARQPAVLRIVMCHMKVVGVVVSRSALCILIKRGWIFIADDAVMQFSVHCKSNAKIGLTL
jgi:hypothetical protein